VRVELVEWPFERPLSLGSQADHRAGLGEVKKLLRVYARKTEIPRVLGGLGIASQPFWLHWQDEDGRSRRHAPVFFAMDR